MTTIAIALVGDRSRAITAHRAIDRALELIRRASDAPIDWTWVGTTEVGDPADTLARFTGVWLVPGSPYASMEGALAAARFARETGRPFLGTCGGFQHALIEFARNAAGLVGVAHAETHPQSNLPLIAPLACSLVEQSGDIRFAPGSRLAAIHGSSTATETYHCRFGFNLAHRGALEAAGLRFTAFDAQGDIRGAELPTPRHPFFIGTLFQPERAALSGIVPPLVRAFVAASYLPLRDGSVSQPGLSHACRSLPNEPAAPAAAAVSSSRTLAPPASSPGVASSPTAIRAAAPVANASGARELPFRPRP